MADLDIISDWSLVLLYDLLCSLTPKGQNGRIGYVPVRTLKFCQGWVPGICK